MTMMPQQIAALRQSLTMRLRNEAQARAVAVADIRKQYVFTVFLSHLFHRPHTNWVLLGGNALLIRTGGGRFTQDIDLAREEEWADPQEARAELQELLDEGRGESPFEFHLVRAEDHSSVHLGSYGSVSAKIFVEARLGNSVFDRFSVDISTRRHLDAPVDQIPLRRIIDHPSLDELPPVPTTPVEPHLADKICALYERHGDDGTTPSTRYRDLADIVRFVLSEQFDAARLIVVLGREAARRKLVLPTRIESPHSTWETRFAVEAQKFAEYPPELRPLEASMNVAGNCLNDVLSGSRTAGIWDPHNQCWIVTKV